METEMEDPEGSGRNSLQQSLESGSAQQISLPEFVLVLLVGPSGSGKTRFATRNFPPEEIISQHTMQSMLGDDGTDEGLHAETLRLMHQAIEVRLKYRKSCVVDADLLTQDSRKECRRLARKYHCKAVAIVFDIPAQVCIDRNALRPDGDPGPKLVRSQIGRMERMAIHLAEEGFKSPYVLGPEVDADALEVVRRKMRSDYKRERGPFDIIGDIHGCFNELVTLLEEMGYGVTTIRTEMDQGPNYRVTASHGRKAIFVGDLVDRGPDSPRVLRLVMDMVNAGVAFCVPGNHDDKLLRTLRGNKVQMKHGLEKTMEQLEGVDPAFREEVKGFIEGLSGHLELDGGALVVAHAGLKAIMHGRNSGEVHAFCLYGETTGEIDQFGLPVRHNWAGEYTGQALVVYGHTPVPEPVWQGNTVNVDTGCVFGGMLTALRYPERQTVSVNAEQIHSQPIRPLHWGNPRIETAKIDESVPYDLVGHRALVSTRHGYHLTLQPQQVSTVMQLLALEAVHSRWLIYLPSTISPPTSSPLPGLLEHPAQAFDYFRKKNILQCSALPMYVGTRVVIVACRNEAAAERRFSIPNPGLGSIFTRTGRPYFTNRAAEQSLLQTLCDGFEATDIWERLHTDWICLECIASPLSHQAPEFFPQVYGAVSEAGRTGLGHARAKLRAAEARGVDVSGILRGIESQGHALEVFDATHRRLTAEEEPSGLPHGSASGSGKLTFHLVRLIATEGQVYLEKSVWVQQELLRALHVAAPGILHFTKRVAVELDSDASQRDATAWWESLHGEPVEGLLVEPAEYVFEKGAELMQAHIKVRTADYLRLLYGPAYDAPESLAILRERSLRLKRETAVREYSLGVEAIHRFVDRQDWKQVYQCIFALLGLETGALDPRF